MTSSCDHFVLNWIWNGQSNFILKTLLMQRAQKQVKSDVAVVLCSCCSTPLPSRSSLNLPIYVNENKFHTWKWPMGVSNAFLMWQYGNARSMAACIILKEIIIIIIILTLDITKVDGGGQILGRGEPIVSHVIKLHGTLLQNKRLIFCGAPFPHLQSVQHK